VLVTQDDDFLKMARKGIKHSGIIYCKNQSRTVKQTIGSLIEIHATETAEQLVNIVRFI
jgi:hypothetical protein